MQKPSFTSDQSIVILLSRIYASATTWNDTSCVQVSRWKQLSVDAAVLGEFEKPRKATISFDMPVHMEQLSYHLTKFHEILHTSIFLNRVEKIQVNLKSDKNNGYFTCKFLFIYDKSCTENQNTFYVQ